MPEEIINITIEDSNEAVNITVDETTEQVNITISDGQPTKTSDLINDGEDGVHPFITLEDIPAGAVESVTGDLVDNTDPANPIINWPTLAEVLSEGNVTDGNQINLTGASAIVLENSSTLVKGTYDFGADGGISRICGVGYEDMWQSGFRHVFDSNGLIRNTTNGFDLIPNYSFDVTLRFKVGSRWTLDNGDTYECTDATEGAAVWVLVNIGIIPNLQEVTDADNITTNDIKVNQLGLYSNDVADYGYLSWTDDLGLSFKNHTTQEVFNANKSGSSLSFINADDNIAKLDASLLTDDRNFLLQDGDGTIAFTSDIPAAQVNSDWNATSGVEEILNKPTIPSINGLELQANKQNSLAIDGTGIKYPTVDAVNSGISNVNTNATHKDTVKLSEAINKGQAVYISGANGTNILVSKASNTTEALSSKTLGLLETTGALNAIVNVVTDGLLAGLNTSTATIGDAVWLGTSGNLLFGLANKPVAPAHLVYIGVVSRVSATVGEIIVKIQNGFELSEIHDVALSSVANNQGLIYESSTSLWKNKTIDKTLVGLANVNNTSDVNKPVSTAQQTAIDAKVSDTITDGVTNIAPSQNAVFDALSLKENALGFTAENVANKQTDLTASATKYPTVNAVNTGLALKQNALSYTPYKNIQTSQTAHTGTVAETVIATATINGGTFNSSDVMKVLFKTTKPATLAACNMRVRINTTNTLVGATQIAILSPTTVTTYGLMSRVFDLQGGNLFGYNFNSTLASDVLVTNTSGNSTTYNPANTLYVFFTIQLGNIADSVTPNLCNIIN
jgi:hypothetical protein